MTEHVGTLGAQPFIGNDPHNAGHDDRRQAFRAVDHADVGTGKIEGVNHVRTQGDQPTTPDEIL
ncbi:hypothetical protein D3C79_1077750 [compost metagenome]